MNLKLKFDDTLLVIIPSNVVVHVYHLGIKLETI